MRSDLIKPALFLSGVVVGIGAGYLLTKSHYRNLAEEEIKSVVDMYNTRKLDHEASAAKKVVMDEEAAPSLELLTKLEELQYVGVGGLADPNGGESVVVPEEWQPSEEEEDDVTLWDRTDKETFLISLEEFMIDRQYENEKVTLVYYQGDKVLADDMNDEVIDPDELVGEDTLNQFGMGSQDEHIVYARNINLDTDFEITRDFRNFKDVAKGKLTWHSHDSEIPKPKIKKMRDDD